MSPENYASLINKSFRPKIIIDTTDFQDYCRQHGYDNKSFHSEIWKYMSDDFCDGPYVHYNKYENTKNKFEELINAFLNDFPEFEDGVRMMFTN